MMEENGPHNALGELPDLLIPPHLLPQVFDLLIGAWHPDAAQQQQMEAHLFTCSSCRIALITLLCVAEEADQQAGTPNAPAHTLRERWITLHCRLEQQQVQKEVKES
ncbi:MAG: hypothetical protein WCD86_22510 [Ktedonobacteraceae bacterium]